MLKFFIDGLWISFAECSEFVEKNHCFQADECPGTARGLFSESASIPVNFYDNNVVEKTIEGQKESEKMILGIFVHEDQE